MPRRLPHLLLDDEPEKILAATRTQRDRTLVLTLLHLGVRVSELCRMRVEDIDFQRRTVFIRLSKYKKERMVPLGKHLKNALRAWLGSRRSGPLFPSREGGGSMTPRAIQKLMQRLAKQAKLPRAGEARRANPHLMRHSYATRLLDSGASIYEVAQLLGHSSISVTENYLFTTMGKLTDAVDRVYD